MLGILSLVFWSITLITTVKYVFIAMRIDNKGEGGIFALYSLIRKWGMVCDSCHAGRRRVPRRFRAYAGRPRSARRWKAETLPLLEPIMSENKEATLPDDHHCDHRLPVRSAVARYRTHRPHVRHGGHDLVFSFLAVVGLVNLSSDGACAKR